MYVLIGNNTKMKNDIWAGSTTCPNCGQKHNFHLMKLVQTATVFFVPVISATQKRYLVCDSCQWAKELKRSEYNEIKKKQMSLFEEGKFPKDIIRQDCHPDEVGIVWRILKLAVSGGFAGFMFLSFLLMVIEEIKEAGDLSALSLFLMVILICAVPFMLSLKNFIPAWKKKKAYDELTGE